MIEPRQVCPGLGGMADFAAAGAFCAHFDHAFFELAPMRVLVARGARPVFKPVRYRLWLQWIFGLVTLIARGRDVAARQHKSRVLVPRQGERGRTISVQRVTFFAL